MDFEVTECLFCKAYAIPVKVLCMLVISIPKVVPDHVLKIVEMSQYYNVYTRDPSKKAEGEGKGERGEGAET